MILNALKFSSDSEVDTATVDFFDTSFIDGGNLDDGAKTLAALKFDHRWFDRGGPGTRPRVTRALAGWS
jgi:hypothetical protein